MKPINGIIARKYIPTQGEAIVTLYQGGANPTIARERQKSSFQGATCFLKTLRLKATIRSLPAKIPPEFNLEDDESKRIAKTLNMEWQGDRYQLSLWVSRQFEPWLEIGAVSLINLNSYPYRTYNLLDLITDGLAQDLGIDDRIGYSFTNLGNGLPTTEDDISIFGSWLEEFNIESAPTIVGGGGNMDLTEIENKLNTIQSAILSLPSSTALTQRLNTIEDFLEIFPTWANTSLKFDILIARIEQLAIATDILPRLDEIAAMLDAPQQPFVESVLRDYHKFLISKTAGFFPHAAGNWGQLIPSWNSGFQGGTQLTLPQEIIFGRFSLKNRLSFWLGGGLTTRPNLKVFSLKDGNNNVLLSGECMTLVGVTDNTPLYPCIIETQPWNGLENCTLTFNDNDTTVASGGIQIGCYFQCY